MPKSVFVQDEITVDVPESVLWPAFEVTMTPLNAGSFGRVQAQMARTPAERIYVDVFVPMLAAQIKRWNIDTGITEQILATLHPALLDRLAGILLNGVGGILKN